MGIIKILISDLLFVIGHHMIIWSAQIVGYSDIAEELKNTKAFWIKDIFKSKKKG